MKLTTALTSVALLSSACASSMPTPQLVQAREAYSRAEKSPDSSMVPASLFSARQALDKAEAVHRDHPQSNEERSYAYVAQRRAERVIVDGSVQKERYLRASLEEQREQLQNSQRLNAERQLNATEEQVKNLNAQIYTQSAQANAALSASEAELARERDRTKRAMESLEKVAQVKEETRGTVLTLSGQVLFLTGKAELLPAARDQLGQVAKALIDQGDARPILVEGHTDSRGDESMNLKLSQERAEAVRSFLVEAGVPAERIKAVGRGESEPVASNDTPEGRANNRRVELVLSNSDRQTSSR